MKEYIFVCLTIISLFQTLNAQPYIFMRSLSNDSTNNCNIIKYNLSNSKSSVFLKYVECLSAIDIDDSQKWLFVGQQHSPITVYSFDDTSIYFELSDSINWVGRALNEPDNNLLFLFATINDITTEQKLFTLNTLNKKMIHSVLLPYSYNEYEEAFFSHDKMMIYFSVEDTTFLPRRADKDKIYYFSISQSNIVKKINLSQFGFSNSDGYILHRGRNGVSIVQSFFRNETKDSYFRIYNFDSDSGSNFIKHQGYSEPYFFNEGKYLLLAETADSVDVEYYTGLVYIYNVSTTELIKTLQLPPKGKIYTFDNYPNMLYYFLKDENRVIALNIDTLIPRYNLNIQVAGKGIVYKVPNQTEYDSSSTVGLKAIPSSGYKFSGWSGDVTGTADSIVVTMNSNKNIIATFIP